jgi:hypothetical protein
VQEAADLMIFESDSTMTVAGRSLTFATVMAAACSRECFKSAIIANNTLNTISSKK